MSDRNRLAVLGSPIHHSKSPAIQRAAYRQLGLDWRYDAVEMTGERLGEWMLGLDSTWRGLSLTMPLKREVIPLLDTVHPLVDRVGAANTVLLTDDGVSGFNTDVLGVTRALAEVGLNSVSSVQLLGAGATAASVLVAVADLGADRVTINARTPEKAQSLVDFGESEGVEVIVRPWGMQDRSLIAPDVIVSTLPGGVGDMQFAESIRAQSVLFDVAYDPWPSALALAWGEAGGTVVSGFDLLVHQAIGQLRLFVGGDLATPLPDEVAVLASMRAAL